MYVATLVARRVMLNLTVRAYNRKTDKDWLSLPLKILGRVEKMRGNEVLVVNSKFPIRDLPLLLGLHGYEYKRTLSMISARKVFVIAAQE